MSKIIAVAFAEYRIAVKSKAFVIGVLMMPILMGGGLVTQKLLEDQVDVTDRSCVVIDQSGFLFDELVAANERRDTETVFETAADGTETQVRPRFLLERYAGEQDAEQAALELSGRVDDGDLFSFLIVSDTILDAESAKRPLAYHTKTPTFEDLPDWIGRVANTTVLQRRFDQAELDQTLVQQLSSRVRVTTLGLVKVKKDGTIKDAQVENKFQTFGIPVAAMMLLFMLVMMTAPALLNQVLEEKMQRISEVLISAVSPFQLLMGKLVGTVFVALTLSFLYLGAVYYATVHFGVSELVAPSVYAWFFLFLILALFMYGSVFSAIGAACSEIKDAQSLMMPAMMMIMIPFFCFGPVMQSPSSTFATGLSMFPPATPMIMMLRIALPPGPPAWQVIAAVAGTAIFTAGCVAAGGKVFRVGILSQGQAPSMRKLIGWVLSK